MSDITRRQALTHLASAFAVAGHDQPLGCGGRASAVQQAAATGPYAPTALTAQQFRTLERLTDLILPAENSEPGALQAGVPGWIDIAAERQRRAEVPVRDRLDVDGLDDEGAAWRGVR